MPDVFVSQPDETGVIPGISDAPAPAPATAPTPQPAAAAKSPVDAAVPGKSLPFLAAFCENPLDVHFRDQDADETIRLFLRRHLITLIPWIVITLILLFLPLVIPPFLSILAISLAAVPLRIVIILLIFYYLIVIGYALVNFVMWFFNIGIITNKNILDADFSNVMYKNISVTSIQELSDVDYTQQGFLQTFFGYGDVFVQTNAKQQNFEFEKVPKPARAAHILLDLMEQFNRL